VTLLIDAAPLVALADPDEPRREQILEILAGESGSLVIPAPTTAEIDYLLGQRFGRAARRAFLTDLAAGRFSVGGLDVDDYTTIAGLESRYESFDLGLADCALVVLADRHRTDRILSFDERHFRTVTQLGGEPFTILPADG
jgi:predicted nucleic acid-binding protein